MIQFPVLLCIPRVVYGRVVGCLVDALWQGGSFAVAQSRPVGQTARAGLPAPMLFNSMVTWGVASSL